MIDTIHIAVCMKPVEGNFAQNALQQGVAGLNIDACRIGTEERVNGGMSSLGVMHDDDWKPRKVSSVVEGRFPANVILDGSEEVTEQFPETKSGKFNQASKKAENTIYGKHSAYSDPKQY